MIDKSDKKLLCDDDDLIRLLTVFDPVPAPSSIELMAIEDRVFRKIDSVNEVNIAPSWSLPPWMTARFSLMQGLTLLGLMFAGLGFFSGQAIINRAENSSLMPLLSEDIAWQGFVMASSFSGETDDLSE